VLSLRSTYLIGVFLESARTARADDLKELERLASKANEETVQKRGGRTLSLQNPNYGGVKGFFNSAFENYSTEVFVGVIDQAIVGFGIIELESLKDGTPHASIKALYVEQEARSVGVGEVLMEEMLTWANLHEAKAVDAIALPGDRATKNFFETHGLVARAIIVQKALSE